MGRLDRSDDDSGMKNKGYTAPKFAQNTSYSDSSSSFASSNSSAPSGSASTGGRSTLNSAPSTTAGHTPTDISSGIGEVNVDMRKFRALVETLRPFSQTTTNDLPSSIAETNAAVIQIVKSTAGSSQQQQIMGVIREVFQDIPASEVKPNTIAAKFIGCHFNSCPGIPIGCGPLCAGSLGNDANLSGWKPCEVSVYMFDKGSFSILTHGSTDQKQAFIYVQRDFTGFTREQIDTLKRNGIERVRIVFLDETSTGTNCQQMHTEFVGVDTLLIRSAGGNGAAGANVNVVNPTPTLKENLTAYSNEIFATPSTGSGWLVFILILAGFILLAVLFFGLVRGYATGVSSAAGDAEYMARNAIATKDAKTYTSGISSLGSGMTPRGAAPAFPGGLFSGISSPI